MSIGFAIIGGMETTTWTRELIDSATQAEDLITKGRLQLISAIRTAARSGMSQRDIAKAIGKSQPEVHRLLHFNTKTPIGRKIRKSKPEILELLARHGITHPRIFGSTVRGTDGPQSDIDILATMPHHLSLMDIARIERELADILGRPVDIVADDALEPRLEQEIRETAVPL